MNLYRIDSTLDSSPTDLATLVTTIGNDKTLIVKKNVQVSASINLAAFGISIQFVDAGMFTVMAGQTLTLGTILGTPMWQIFDGLGTVAFDSVEKVLPQWYGAVGDGVTDDTDAIQAAIAALVSGGCLYFPNGTYLCTGNVLVVNKKSKILGDIGAVLKIVADASTSKKLLQTSGAYRFLVEGLTFDVNNSDTDTSTHQSLYPSGFDSLIVRGCKFINSAAPAYDKTVVTHKIRGYGLYLGGTFGDAIVEDCEFEKQMYATITLPAAVGKSIVVRNCKYNECGADAIEIDVPSGGVDYVLIDGCKMKDIGHDDNASGFAIGASGAAGSTIGKLVAINNHFEDITSQGVHIEDGVKRFVLSKNTYLRCGNASTGTYNEGIYVAVTNAGRECESFDIDSETIENDANTNWAIYLGTVQPIKDGRIRGCTINGNGNGQGIRVGSGHSGHVIEHNTIKNCDGIGLAIGCPNSIVSENVCFDDQGTKTQTYGLQVLDDANGTVFRDNWLYGNLTGDIDKGSILTPKQIVNRRAYLPNTVIGATSWSAYVGVIDLGKAANGILHVEAKDTFYGYFHVSDFLLNWDGITLMLEFIGSQGNGSLDISNTPSSNFNLTGSVLGMRAYNGAAYGITFYSWMTLKGIISLL